MQRYTCNYGGGGVTEQEKAVRGAVGLLVLLQLFLDLPVGLLAHLIVLVGLAGAEAAHATGRAAAATTQRARAPPRHRPNDEESPPVTDGRRQPVRRPYERRIRDRRSSPAATAAAATTIRRRRRHRPAYRAGRASSISTTTANAGERGG